MINVVELWRKGKIGGEVVGKQGWRVHGAGEIVERYREKVLQRNEVRLILNLVQIRSNPSGDPLPEDNKRHPGDPHAPAGPTPAIPLTSIPVYPKSIHLYR